MTLRRKIFMVSAVWGEWHVAMMLDANFPTLLALGNLPALADKHDIEFLIYTTPEDKIKIEQSASFQEVKKIVPVKLDTNLFNSNPGNSPVIHHEAWIIAKRKAEKEAGLVWNMLPDVMFSDGSLAHVGDLLAAGKQAIMWFYPRAVAETFVPAAQKKWNDGHVLSIPGREMLGLNLQHLHPVMAAYFVDSPYFPNHPELIIWPIRGDGLLVRMLINVYNVFDPNRFQLNEQQLPTLEHKDEDYSFIQDSDVFFGTSLAPLGKDSIWYNRSRDADPISIARWWLEYDSPSNDQVASHDIKLHTKDYLPASWRKAERASDLFLNKIITAREGLRVAHASQELGCRHAASIIFYAVETGILHRTFARLERALIFVPDDDAMGSMKPELYTQLLSTGSRHFLIQFLRRHVVFIDQTAAQIEKNLEILQSINLVTVSGEHLRLRKEGKEYLLNDLSVQFPPEKTGMHSVCSIAGVLF